MSIAPERPPLLLRLAIQGVTPASTAQKAWQLLGGDLGLPANSNAKTLGLSLGNA